MVAPATACPISAIERLSGQFKAGGKVENGPSYGYGQWPAYLSGQTSWYSEAGQGMVVLISPDYPGPVLVRARRLDGSGSVTISELGPDLGGGATGIFQGGLPPYWGMAAGAIAFSTPGCYGIQFDGMSWTSVAVIPVLKGPPPPG